MPDRKYDVFGPFEIPRTEKRQRVDRKSFRHFWNEVEALRQKNEGLASASGCYIFAIRAGKGSEALVRRARSYGREWVTR